MSIAIMSVTFGQSSSRLVPYGLPTHTAEVGLRKVKPGSRYAAESRMPSRH
jgi:hypothetical protein